MRAVLLGGLLLSSAAVAAPDQLCLNEVCQPVTYARWQSLEPTFGPAPAPWFALAQSSVRGYPVLGWAGPCMPYWTCPLLDDQAFQDLTANALKANRVLRYANEP